MLTRDVLIVGCGLTGAVIARELAEHGKKVEIWERRNHIGGNMYDYTDEHGFLVQKYGPHTFHTKKKALYDYMCRFSKWSPYKLKCGAVIDGKCTPTPFNFKTIDDFYDEEAATKLKHSIRSAFGESKTATVLEALQSKDAMVRQYAQFLFEKDYSLYTAKQWGVSPDVIDASVLKRVPLRFSYEEGYFDDDYEVMPQAGFTDFFGRLLNHPNIVVRLNHEALNYIEIDEANRCVKVEGSREIRVVYSGALDELFRYRYGALPYRSLRFEWGFSERDSNYQSYPVVAYPQAEGFTRITEYKKLPVQDLPGSSYAVEYPVRYSAGGQSEPYYPVLTKKSEELYAQYQRLASTMKNLLPCGRLGDFKYYNMDEALNRALEISELLIR